MLPFNQLRTASATAIAVTLLTASISAGTVAQDESLATCEGLGDVSLTVGFSEAGEVIQQEFKNLVAAFEEANPNVMVEVIPKDFATSIATIRLAMSGDDPPDLIQGNHGWTINGALMQAGLLLNLDPYAEELGWVEKYPESALTVQRFSEDGKTFGEGSIWSLTQAIQFAGVFYNKEILSQLGVNDVRDIDSREAFIEVLEKAKAEGIIPIMLGDSDGWPAGHNVALKQGWYVPVEDSNAWVYNVPGSTYDTEGHRMAAQEFIDWAKNGYYNDDALAISFNDAVARFGAGEAAFYIGGTWALADIESYLGDKAGFMLFPAGEDGKHAAVGGYSLPFAVSSKTEYPGCAVALLDFITTSQEAIDAQVAAGRVAAVKAGADADIASPLLKEEAVEYERLNADNGLMTWTDWPTPTMFDLMNAQHQLLFGDQITPEQYTQTIQADWDEFMADRE